MSPRQPRLTVREAIELVKSKCFILARQSGSHKIFYNPETKKRVTIPDHGKNIVLHPKIVKEILEDTQGN